MQEIIEVYRHWQGGDSQRAIARKLGLSRNTVSQWIEVAERQGVPRGTAWSREQWMTFIREHLPKSVDVMARSPWFQRLDAHRDTIRREIKEGLDISVIWQRLRDDRDNNLDVSLATFRRYVRACIGPVVRASEVVIHRPAGEPGEEAQVDFGQLGRWQDPATGLKHTLWAFLMVLAWSRHLFLRVVRRLDGRTWLQCHVEAFSFFNSVPVRIVLDNLADGVVKADMYDPRVNRAYGELASYYGTLLDPCRVASPTDKPHVERYVGYVKSSYWRGFGEQLSSLEEQQRAAERWSLEVAGRRIHRTTRQRPLEVFEHEEQPAMRPLPPEPWEICEWLKTRVGRDAHCALGGEFYSVPWAHIGRDLTVRRTDKLVQFFWQEQLVKTQPRVVPPQRRQTDFTDLPPDRIAFFQRTPQWCLQQARSLGPSVAQVVGEILATNVLYHLRQAQGVVRLADRFGAERLETACQRAAAGGDPSYKTVKNILAGGLDRQPSVFDGAGGAAGVGAFVHGREAFATPPSAPPSSDAPDHEGER